MLTPLLSSNETPMVETSRRHKWHYSAEWRWTDAGRERTARGDRRWRPQGARPPRQRMQAPPHKLAPMIQKQGGRINV